ncbi:hypothetical protein E2C01_029290 [Portunus trituberculatus]|uniref:Uncharacterized protein n=1 Tax=Portunus trituberculatus TaxID=210409 RepID=A0A5B7ESH1_PORTR|nr:hypothetical protein [Portunus trituberculatus]
MFGKIHEEDQKSNTKSCGKVASGITPFSCTSAAAAADSATAAASSASSTCCGVSLPGGMAAILLYSVLSGEDAVKFGQQE